MSNSRYWNSQGAQKLLDKFNSQVESSSSDDQNPSKQRGSAKVQALNIGPRKRSSATTTTNSLQVQKPVQRQHSSASGKSPAKSHVFERRSRSRVRRVRGGTHWKKDIVAAEDVNKKKRSRKLSSSSSSSSESCAEGEDPAADGSTPAFVLLAEVEVLSSDESDGLEAPPRPDQVEAPPGPSVPNPNPIEDLLRDTTANTCTVVALAEPSNASSSTRKPVSECLIDARLEAEMSVDTLIRNHQNPDSEKTWFNIETAQTLYRYIKSLGEAEDKAGLRSENLGFSAQVATEFAAVVWLFDEPLEELKLLKPLFLKKWNECVSPEAPVSQEEADKVFEEVGEAAIAKWKEMALESAEVVEALKRVRMKTVELEEKKIKLTTKLEKHREELENGNEEVRAEEVPLTTHQLVKNLTPAFALWTINQEPNELHEAVLIETKFRWSKGDVDLLRANKLVDYKYNLRGFQPKENDDSTEGPVVSATKIAKLKRLNETKQDLEWKFRAKYGENWAKTKGEVAVRYHRKIPYHHGFVEVEAVPAFSLGVALFEKIIKEESDKIKNWKYQDGADEEIGDEIDWEDVADDVSSLLRKEKKAKDCKQVYKHLAHPSLTDAPWTEEERERLRTEGATAAKGYGNWEEVVKKFPGRSVFQCIQRYRLDDVARNKVVWNDEMDEKLLEYIRENGPNLIGACYHLKNPRLTQDDIINRWSKHLNPILRKGPFTKIEDVLLILHLVKWRGFLVEDFHFTMFAYYLPWRNENAWRERADSLFADFIAPWTLEEDKLLLRLAQDMPGKWSKICKSFTTQKNRKNCASRHKRLMDQIGDGPGRSKTLAEYHIKYTMMRKNAYEVGHLHDMMEILQWLVEQTSDDISEFSGLEPTRPPAEWELKWMLIKIDPEVVKQAIKDLSSYLELRAASLPTPTPAKRRQTFDRRSFKLEDPQSVASALHVRGIKLKNLEEFETNPLNTFEKEVWVHYASFCTTKKPKPDKQRPNIPSRAVLINLPEVQRIVIKEAFDPSGAEYEYVPLRRGRRKVVGQSAVSASTSGTKTKRASNGAEKDGPKETTSKIDNAPVPSTSAAFAQPSTSTANVQKKQAAKSGSSKRHRQPAASESEPESVPVSKKAKAPGPSKQLKRKRIVQKKAHKDAPTTDFDSDEAPKGRKIEKNEAIQTSPPVATIGRILRPRK